MAHPVYIYIYWVRVCLTRAHILQTFLVQKESEKFLINRYCRWGCNRRYLYIYTYLAWLGVQQIYIYINCALGWGRDEADRTTVAWVCLCYVTTLQHSEAAFNPHASNEMRREKEHLSNYYVFAHCTSTFHSTHYSCSCQRLLCVVAQCNACLHCMQCKCKCIYVCLSICGKDATKEIIEVF